MNDERLLDRIARADPAGRDGVGIDPITSPRARTLLEDIMNTPNDQAPRHDRRLPTWVFIPAVAAVIAIVAVGVFVLGRDDDPAEVATTQPPATSPAATSPVATSPTAPPAPADVLELNTGVEDLLASCAVLDPAIVGQAPIAFKGTVTSAEGGVVALTVDQAYRGVDAQAVSLLAPEGMEALIGGVAWEVGQQYLVTAYDDTVAYCGQTGLATPELQAIFDQAFAGG